MCLSIFISSPPSPEDSHLYRPRPVGSAAPLLGRPHPTSRISSFVYSVYVSCSGFVINSQRILSNPRMGPGTTFGVNLGLHHLEQVGRKNREKNQKDATRIREKTGNPVPLQRRRNHDRPPGRHGSSDGPARGARPRLRPAAGAPPTNSPCEPLSVSLQRWYQQPLKQKEPVT